MGASTSAHPLFNAYLILVICLPTTYSYLIKYYDAHHGFRMQAVAGQWAAYRASLLSHVGCCLSCA